MERFAGTDMWPGDRGLVAHWVRAMRNDYTVQCERVGDRRYLKFEFITSGNVSTGLGVTLFVRRFV